MREAFSRWHAFVKVTVHLALEDTERGDDDSALASHLIDTHTHTHNQCGIMCVPRGNQAPNNSFKQVPTRILSGDPASGGDDHNFHPREESATTSLLIFLFWITYTFGSLASPCSLVYFGPTTISQPTAPVKPAPYIQCDHICNNGCI